MIQMVCEIVCERQHCFSQSGTLWRRDSFGKTPEGGDRVTVQVSGSRVNQATWNVILLRQGKAENLSSSHLLPHSL